MARYEFGGLTLDLVTSPITADRALRVTSATLTVWTAQAGGSQVTDLLLNGSPTSTIPVPPSGQIPRFQGPDGVASLWASANGGDRLQLVPLGAIIDAAAASLAVGTTNDGVIAGRVGDSASATRAALSAAYLDKSSAQTAAGVKQFTDKVTGLAFHRKGQKRVSMLASGIDADSTGATSVFSALGTALSAAGTGSELFYPPGTYLQGAGPYLGSQSFKADMTIRGAGPGLTTIKCPANSTGVMFELIANGITLKDLTLDMSAGSQTGGNFAVRLNNVAGTRLENVRIIGSTGASGTRAVYILGAVTDTKIRGLRATNATWGLLTDDAAVVNEFRMDDFNIDGGNVLGDAIQFNVPTGSARDIQISNGLVKNYTATATNYGMGLGFAGQMTTIDVSHIVGKNLGLDCIHFESDDSPSTGISVSHVLASNCARAAVSIQCESGGTYEDVSIVNNSARSCLTGSFGVAGVYEFAGMAGVTRGSRMSGNRAFDCGNSSQDTVSALVGSLTTYSRVTDTTSVRQLGTRAAGSRGVINNGGGTNVTEAALSY